MYNITQFLDYHPGGVSILMEGAGKDCTAFFLKYHTWVNIKGMLSKCFLGTLADECPSIEENGGGGGGGEEKEKRKKEKVSVDAVLQLLQLEEEEEEQEQVGGARSRLRINPGLQNLAASGTLHDATASDTSSSTTSATFSTTKI